MLDQIKKFLTYLITKKSELADLDTKDALLAKVVLDIHRKRTGTSFTLVPLSALKRIHAIDRENTIRATEQRIRKLNEARDHLLARKDITREILAEYLPSVSWIKVVKQSEDSYIAYEGNGRLAAMQEVFTPADGIRVEVEEYHFRDPEKIIRRMNRVRQLNGLLMD